MLLPIRKGKLYATGGDYTIRNLNSMFFRKNEEGRRIPRASPSFMKRESSRKRGDFYLSAGRKKDHLNRGGACPLRFPTS